MITDALLLLSGAISGTTNAITGQTATGTDTSVLSTNTIDLLQNRDIGSGADLFGRFELTAAATGGTSVEMQIIAADAAALTGNVQVIGTTGAIPVAQATLGSRFACSINPRLANKGQRYVGARYVFVGAVAAGAYVADIGLEVQDGQKFMPAGFTVI